MSEVAVKIYETRKEVQRIQLAAPLHGKDGANQVGTWINTDTSEVIDGYVYKRTGTYRMDCVLICKQGDPDEITGPFANCDDEHLIEVENFWTPAENVEHWACSYFITKPYLKVPVEGLGGISKDTIVEHYHFTIRYLDE